MRWPESGSNKFDRHADPLIFRILTLASLFPTLSSRSSETDIKSSEPLLYVRASVLSSFIYLSKEMESQRVNSHYSAGTSRTKACPSTN